MPIKIQLRRGTASQWVSANPILSDGEFGYESDTLKFKVGDGTSSWSILSYSSAQTASISSAIINTSVFVAPEERFNIISGSATGTINIDTITSTAWVYANPGNTNFTVNVRGNASNTLNSILSTGDAITVGVLNRTGTSSSAFFATTVQVDGSTVIPVWNNSSYPPSSIPSQSASGYDSYTYTFIKTASSTYITLGSWTQFR